MAWVAGQISRHCVMTVKEGRRRAYYIGVFSHITPEGKPRWEVTGRAFYQHPAIIRRLMQVKAETPEHERFITTTVYERD